MRQGQFPSNKEPKEEFKQKDECLKVLAVGSETQKGLLRMYNHKEDVELNLQASDCRKYTDVCHIKSFANGIENFIVGTDRGQIKVFGLPPLL